MEPTDKPVDKLKHLAKSVAGKFKKQSKIWLKNIASKRKANVKTKAITSVEAESKDMRSYVSHEENNDPSETVQDTFTPDQSKSASQQNITPPEKSATDNPPVIDIQDYSLENSELVKKSSTSEKEKNKILPLGQDTGADKTSGDSTSNITTDKTENNLQQCVTDHDLDLEKKGGNTEKPNSLDEETQALAEIASDKAIPNPESSDANTVKNVNKLLSSVPGLLESSDTVKDDVPHQVKANQKDTSHINANKPNSNSVLTTRQTEEKNETENDKRAESSELSEQVTNEPSSDTTKKHTLISKILHRNSSLQSDKKTDNPLSLVKSARIKHNNSKLNLDKTSLLNLRENSALFLNKIIEQYLETDVPYSQYTTFYSASYCHRNAAILDYVLDGNVQSFFSNLYLSMENRRTYLLKVMAGLKPNSF